MSQIACFLCQRTHDLYQKEGVALGFALQEAKNRLLLSCFAQN